HLGDAGAAVGGGSVSVGDHVRERVWPRRGVAGQLGYFVLRPLSGLFGLGVGLRGLGYRLGVLRVRRATIPVVSVGNLAVGGTGKTPFTLWLARALMARGVRVGILSRGYGGSARGVTIVARGHGPEVGPEIAGDEAVMMAKSFAGPVITAARRIDGAAAAAALGCELIVLDDGFQHRAIARDFDCVLVDARRGPLLPAGPLREPLRAVRRADAILLVEREDGETPAPIDAGVAVHRLRFEPVGLVESVAGQWHEYPLGRLATRRVVAVTGVARPAAFYAQLRRWEAVVDEVFEYPDHHRYTRHDWQDIARRGHAADLVVTTEKDLVKLEAFPFATGKLVALRIAPQVERADELIAAILAKTGLSAHPAEEDPHGHQ
ncbi:MAG: tetraacyldisaccharide 4'-kinase, partial [Candidatus Binatia bacterium]